jgi:1-acyl-sn-glycerol-3-phosphate acyltransferase
VRVVPPTIVRRLVLAPLVAVAELVLIVVSPLLTVVAVIASPLTGGWRPLRLLAIVVGYTARHLACAVACFGLWLASGLGRRADSPRFQRAHYAVLRWFVGGVFRSVIRWARVTVEVEGEQAAEALSARRRPAVVLSRHAGEGDSLLVLHELLCRHRRRPRVVLHHALRMDPLIDVLGRRLPNRFVDPRGGDTEVEIAAMSRDLGADGAVLIFPEGGNFSPARRRRGIERLEEAGHDQEAAWARDMQHVIAPRPGGALAALEAAPDADVVLIGHVGVPGGFAELWRLLPDRQTVKLRMWLVPAGELPAGHDARIDWLFGRWRALDDWVAGT